MSSFVVDWQQLIMSEIANPAITRREVAGTYLILLYENDPQINWEAINKAIIERWSHSALLWIKNRAWKAAEASP